VKHFIVANAEELGFVGWCGRNHKFRRCRTEHGAHVAVERAGRAPALHMPKQGDARVFAQLLRQHLLDILAGDGVALAVDGALGHDDHVVAAPARTAGVDRVAHRRLPAIGGRAFGEEDPVGAGGQPAHQRQVAGVAAHHLDDEAALVAGRSRGDGIHRLHDAVQRSVRADGHVGAEHVVVDGADQPDDGQIGVRSGSLGRQFALRHQFGEQLRPLLAKEVGAGEAAVAADGHQRVDAVVEQIVGGAAAPFARAEILRPRGTDDRAALLQDAAYVEPGERADVAAAFHHALVAFVDGVDFGAGVDAGAHHGAHGGVHPLRVTAAGENADAFGCG
jgi:hypothetical protein